MNPILCRQCGHSSPREDFPDNQFQCPWCDWQEILQPTTGAAALTGTCTLLGEADGDGSGGVDATAVAAPPGDDGPEVTDVITTNDEPETCSAPADHGDPAGEDDPMPQPNCRDTPRLFDLKTDQLADLAAEDFACWCGDLFERFGYDVNLQAGTPERSSDLALERDGRKALADCPLAPETGVVDRLACQSLVGAMVGAGIPHGILITSGTFTDACRAYAQALGDFTIDLIDGDDLRRTVGALTGSALMKWLV